MEDLVKAQTCYDSAGVKRPNDIPCGGWSANLNSSLCCPQNYHCMRNGLCMLPEYASAISRIGSNVYLPSHPGRQKAAWVQLPTCTSSNWRECAFNPSTCFSNPTSITEGFFPFSGQSCPEDNTLIAPGDWISCSNIGTTKSTCSSTQSSISTWGPLGDIICPSNRTTTSATMNCTNLPYGATDSSKAGDSDQQPDHSVPLVIIYPIVIFFFFAILGGILWLVMRRRRRASSSVIVVGMENRRSTDSWDQDLPAYERQCTIGRSAQPWWHGSRSDVVGTVWGEAPPEYCPPKQPEVAHIVTQNSPDLEAGSNAREELTLQEMLRPKPNAPITGR